ncbi:MAG TPA: hypothetical protein VG860_14645 [Terriglobia bacterium]|nr:hypothetical protein [Terriglobia bacterium]
MRIYAPVIVTVLAVILFAGCARASSPGFDLAGPPIEVKVIRGGKSLPISEVPNLLEGDRLWLHADLPEDQSARYLLIAAFLRGTTNPPPEDWFTRAETWSKQEREEGMEVTVPEGAQQALVFLAPQTGGDFGTLRSAVRGRPGSFVRAAQDLNQASLNRSRLDEFLKEIRDISDNDPAELKTLSATLARSLEVKLKAECFDLPADEQASCLTASPDNLVLDDPHSASMVAALTSGPSADLISAVTATPMAGGGYYSAYVGAVVDVVRIMGNIHTAVYQYLPALAMPGGYDLNLKLNSPPSFRNPKSVLVVGLPAVEAAQLPPLRALDPQAVYCLQKPSLVLPVQGAPLVFSTQYGHTFTLHLTGKSGQPIDLPAVPVADKGGFVIDASAAKPDELDAEVTGDLRGHWGFKDFDGPSFHLRVPQNPLKWTVPPEEQHALVVGREDTLDLEVEDACCVDKITVADERGDDFKTTWKILEPAKLELHIDLKDAKAGPAVVLVHEYGDESSAKVTLQAFSEEGRLQAFAIHAGDAEGLLKGTRLDEVAGVELSGVHFAPGELKHQDDEDELTLSATKSADDPLGAGQRLTAEVSLKDGRVQNLETTVQAPRPKVTLLSKQVGPVSTSSPLQLGDTNELPQNATLTFVLKSNVPAAFARTEKIEVASMDGSFHTLLSLADNNLTLEDAATVLATLDSMKAFGPSAFGPLQFRAVDDKGSQGDWQPLATLVRLPLLKDVHCPAKIDQSCTLSGGNLFLIDSVASDPQFKTGVPVPAGFVDSSLSVPRPNGTVLYIKLRDDPSAVNVAALPVLPAP